METTVIHWWVQYPGVLINIARFAKVEPLVKLRSTCVGLRRATDRYLVLRLYESFQREFWVWNNSRVRKLPDVDYQILGLMAVPFCYRIRISVADLMYNDEALPPTDNIRSLFRRLDSRLYDCSGYDSECQQLNCSLRLHDPVWKKLGKGEPTPFLEIRRGM